LIAESDLSKVYVDEQLAAKLMMQDETHEDHALLNFGEHKHDRSADTSHQVRNLDQERQIDRGMQGNGCVAHR
jgi:hypothetical protein